MQKTKMNAHIEQAARKMPDSINTQVKDTRHTARLVNSKVNSALITNPSAVPQLLSSPFPMPGKAYLFSWFGEWYPL